MKIFKFGGASLKSAELMANVKNIISGYSDEPMVIVVSAAGKTTDKLESFIQARLSGDKETACSILDEIAIHHQEIMTDIFQKTKHYPIQFNALLQELYDSINTSIEEENDRFYDSIIGYGEMLSSVMVSAYLCEQGIGNAWYDVRQIIRANGEYGEGRIDWGVTALLTSQRLKPIVEKHKIVVTQGFLGSNDEGHTISLGRDGSDYTAAILGWCLDAEYVCIWKDVQGVLNADPRWFSKTEQIPALNYSDAVELAFYGANVIHPKTIKPLQNKNIPLWVKSFIHPEINGTVIDNRKEELTQPSYIFKVKQVFITISPRDFSFIAEENLRDIFDIFSLTGIKIHVMQNTAISFSCCTNNDSTKIPLLIKLLRKKFVVVTDDRDIELITIRSYTSKIITEVCEEKEILLEQKSRNTAQLVVRNLIAPDRRNEVIC
jgi:aspartate kinase